jgi:hypothetical protein
VHPVYGIEAPPPQLKPLHRNFSRLEKAFGICRCICGISAHTHRAGILGKNNPYPCFEISTISLDTPVSPPKPEIVPRVARAIVPRGTIARRCIFKIEQPLSASLWRIV